ncbi:hypothetical protein AAC387_Pa10g1738 [Persea americana]
MMTMMQISSNARRISRVLPVSISLYPDRFLSSNVEKIEDICTRNHHQWQLPRSFFFRIPRSSGITDGAFLLHTANISQLDCHSLCSRMSRACLTTEANTVTEGSTEAVNEFYLKMLKSVEARTMPPNAWLWSLVENCANREDIKLLFQILQNLRRFRLSNLRIHSNFNSHLCYRVAEACARTGALDFGKKTLWKHNVYGLTPTIGAAHYLLLYAKEHNDAKLMVEIMKLLKRNSLPLQPGTADIVFSICYNMGDWDLISKYSKRFIKAGVKLHRTAFGIWMEFAAKLGDVQSIWKIEELRAKSVKQHSLETGFSCAKGYLLEGKPEDAATVIHVLSQGLPDPKKPGVAVELQKLVHQWPLELVKQQKKEKRKKLAGSLRSDIHKMVKSLLDMGLEVTLDLKDLIKEEPIPS